MEDINITREHVTRKGGSLPKLATEVKEATPNAATINAASLQELASIIDLETATSGSDRSQEQVIQSTTTKEYKGPKSCLIIFILFTINLLNYMDRFTLAAVSVNGLLDLILCLTALLSFCIELIYLKCSEFNSGVLKNVQVYYVINDAQGGFLQTIYMISYMTFSPICVFFGDRSSQDSTNVDALFATATFGPKFRYSRKWIMLAGMAVWILAIFLSTFVPSHLFSLFAISRAVVGTGQAGYTIVAPTVIADMYAGKSRTRMLTFFYLAIPCGTGLGFVIGSTVAAITGSWNWGIRSTQILGIICIGLLSVFFEEPERGGAERENGEIAAEVVATNYSDDIKALLKNLTYILSTAAYTATIFVVGTLSWWTPTAIYYSEAIMLGLNSTEKLSPLVKARDSMIFGAVTCLSGMVGVVLGSLLSSLIRTGVGPFHYVQTVRSDPIVCAIGAILAAPTMYFFLQELPHNQMISWLLMFICVTTGCFNWAINVNMLMAVVIPTRRNSANSWQILVIHLFGDSSGPYIIGWISDVIRGNDDSPTAHYKSLATSLDVATFLLVVGGLLYLMAAYTFVRDLRRFQEEMGVTTTSRLSVADADEKCAS